MTPAEFHTARLTMGLSLSRMAAAMTDPEHDAPPVNRMTVYKYEHGMIIPHPVVLLVKLLVAQANHSP